MFENLNDKFDIAPSEESTAVIPAEDVVEKAKAELRDNDELAVETLQALVAQGRTAVDNMIEIANNMEHPRAFEVVAQLLKTVADNAKDLLEIEKKRAEINKIKNEKAPANKGPRTQNNLFVGSTADLLKALKSATPVVIPEAEVEVIE